MTTKKTEAKKTSMDLSVLDSVTRAEEGVGMEIIHPVTREPMGVKIRLMGADSKTYQTRKSEAIRKRIRSMKNPAIAKNTDEEDAIDIITACTLGWENLEEHGEPVPFSEAKARDIYTRYPDVREQVSAFIEDRANFLPPLKED